MDRRDRKSPVVAARLSLTLVLQVWDVQEVNGENRYVRRIFFTGPKGEELTARQVFDYREFRDYHVSPNPLTMMVTVGEP